MVYFQALGYGFIVEGFDTLQWFNRSQNSSEIRPDGGLEDQKWRPNGRRWRSGGGQMPPQGPQRSTSAAWSAPIRCQEASRRVQDRLVHVFAFDFGPPKAPKGSRNRTQKRTKSDTKMTFVSDHVLASIFIDLEVRKVSLSGHEKDPKHVPK